MTPRTSRGLWLVVAAVTSAAAGCSSGTTSTAPLNPSQSVALAVAHTFDRMGDSVVAAHGDSDAAIRFYGAAAVLKRVPAFDTITITIDSVPTTFNAVGIAVTDSGGPATCPTPPMDNDADDAWVCPWGVPHTTRTLFAWQPGQPPHIIQLVASSDSGSIGLATRHRFGDGTSSDSSSDTTSVGVTTDSSGNVIVPARLKYFSGDGTGIWWGTSGSQMNAVQAGTTACPQDTSAADSTSTDSTSTDSTSSADRGGMGGHERDGHGWHGLHMATASCVTATLTFQFSGTVSLPPVDWWHRNTASGTHTISMEASTVPGAYVTMTPEMNTGGGGH